MLLKPQRPGLPNIVIRALRDPDGANLDRIQVIKGWLDKKDKTHERIYDVICTDDAKIVGVKAQGRSHDSPGAGLYVGSLVHTVNTYGMIDHYFNKTTPTTEIINANCLRKVKPWVSL